MSFSDYEDVAGVTRAHWSGGGGAAPITRAQYDIASTAVPDSTPTKLPLAFNYGTELLDIADPDDWTPVVSGVYAVSARVTFSDVLTATPAYLSVTLDEDDFAAVITTSQDLPEDSTTDSLTVTFPFYVPAGSPCNVIARALTDCNASGVVYIQRLS